MAVIYITQHQTLVSWLETAMAVSPKHSQYFPFNLRLTQSNTILWLTEYHQTSLILLTIVLLAGFLAVAQTVPQRFRQRGLPRRGRQEVAGGYLAPAADAAPESYVTPAAEAPALYSGLITLKMKYFQILMKYFQILINYFKILLKYFQILMNISKY